MRGAEPFRIACPLRRTTTFSRNSTYSGSVIFDGASDFPSRNAMAWVRLTRIFQRWSGRARRRSGLGFGFSDSGCHPLAARDRILGDEVMVLGSPAYPNVASGHRKPLTL